MKAKTKGGKGNKLSNKKLATVDKFFLPVHKFIFYLCGVVPIQSLWVRLDLFVTPCRANIERLRALLNLFFAGQQFLRLFSNTDGSLWLPFQLLVPCRNGHSASLLPTRVISNHPQSHLQSPWISDLKDFCVLQISYCGKCLPVTCHQNSE